MEGVSDKLKVEYLEFWFSRVAQHIVRSIVNNTTEEDHTKVLKDIKEVLMAEFGEKEFDADEMIKKLTKELLFEKHDYKGIHEFMVDVQCKYRKAEGKGKTAVFGVKNTYADILTARLPQWTKKFGSGRQESTLENF
jgi:hypothetical protein